MEDSTARGAHGKRRLPLLFALLLVGGLVVYWFGPRHTYHFHLLCNEQQYTGITLHGFLGDERHPCVNEFYRVWQPFQDRDTALATAVECLSHNEKRGAIHAISTVRDHLQCPVEPPVAASPGAACSSAPPACEQYDSQQCVCLAWKQSDLKECGEYELCLGKAVICTLAGDDADGGAGTLIHLGVETKELVFGQWSNQECDTSGKGWHAEVGSCGTRQGTRYKRCTSVFVVPEESPVGEPTSE